MAWSVTFDPHLPGDDPELRFMIEWFFDTYAEPEEEDHGGEDEEPACEAIEALADRFPYVERDRLSEAAAFIEAAARRWLAERRPEAA